jgi:virulence-associated protein VapD
MRKLKDIQLVILPIFNKYSLLTSKNFYFNIFQKALLIYLDPNLNKEDKDIEINQLKAAKLPDNYISPIWLNIQNKVTSIEDANKIISKSWLIGFTEAEGSFYLVKKEENRISHVFEITQKLDMIFLIAISYILDMKVLKKSTYNTVITTNKSSVEKVIKYYQSTMKGMKSLEFRIWMRSYNKKLNYNELLKIRDQMRKIRSIRLMKDFSIRVHSD